MKHLYNLLLRICILFFGALLLVLTPVIIAFALFWFLYKGEDGFSLSVGLYFENILVLSQHKIEG